jgi:DNA-binding MarR family transcriptional regulator
MGKLKDEVRNGRPQSQSVEREVFLSLQKTADLLMRDLEDLLKPHSLSPTQYHVLRILRTAREGGLACNEITQRMSTHDPDMTRLLDRLETRKLLARTREKDDRRVIRVRITPDGLQVLRSLDEPVKIAHRRQLGHLGERRIRVFAKLLEIARVDRE